MSTSTTTNLSLIKEGGDEYIKTHRAHANANLDAVDTAIGNINSAVTALQNAITNANALLGTLGVDGNGDPLISAASARATLDAAQDDSSGITLASAASNISTLLATTGIASTPSGKTLQGQISTLQDSVSVASSSVGALAIGGTWQIPSELLAHTFIVLQIGRYGKYDTVTTLTEQIRSSGYAEDSGSLIFFDGGTSNYWKIKISQTGLLTLVSTSTSGNAPNILARGIL